MTSQRNPENHPVNPQMEFGLREDVLRQLASPSTEVYGTGPYQLLALGDFYVLLADQLCREPDGEQKRLLYAGDVAGIIHLKYDEFIESDGYRISRQLLTDHLVQLLEQVAVNRRFYISLMAQLWPHIRVR